MISDLLKTNSPNTIRYLLLSHHYRSPWEYHEKDLEHARQTITLITDAIKIGPQEEGEETDTVTEKLITALENDLDTPEALKILQETAKNQKEKPTQKRHIFLQEMSMLLGFYINE